MRKQEPEFIQADIPLRKTLFILIALYILFLLWLEPMIDLLLSFLYNSDDPLGIPELNQQKIVVAGMAFAMARSLPMIFLIWFAYRGIMSARMPPARMRFPFTVNVIKGKHARMFAMLLISVCLLLIYHEFYLLSHSIFT